MYNIVLSIKRLSVVTSLLPVLQLISIVVAYISVDLQIQSLLVVYLFALLLVLVIITLQTIVRLLHNYLEKFCDRDMLK